MARRYRPALENRANFDDLPREENALRIFSAPDSQHGWPLLP
jgi:hypothetical protein